MKPQYYMLLLAATVLSGCQSDDERKVQEVAENYAINLYTCNFQEAEKLCTPEGREDVQWFASNLTEGDVKQLANQEKGLEVTCAGVEVDDTVATVTLELSNAMLVDSLEHEPALGDVCKVVKLVLRDKKWKISK